MLANHSHAIQPQSWYPPIVMLHNQSCNHHHATQTCHAIQPQSWYPPIVMLHNQSCYATIIMLLRHVMLSNQSCYSTTIMLPKQVMLSKHHHDIQMCHVIHRSCCLTTVSHVTQLPSCYPHANQSCHPTMIMLLKCIILYTHHHSTQTSHIS